MKFLYRFWVLLLLPWPLCAQSQSRPSPQNAAVKYLRADIALRESYAFPLDPSTALQKAIDSPLDENSEKLVAAAEGALTEFEHGSELKRCDWELSVQDAVLASTSHREAVRDLVLVSGLRARIRFRHNHPEDAVKDSLAAITAARQLSTDGSIASVLISYRLEDEISQILAHNLTRLSRSQCRQLASHLSSAPRGSDMASALRAEDIDRHPLLTLVRGATSREDLVNHLLDGAPALNGDRKRAQELVDGCGGSVQGFDNCMRQQRDFCKFWLARFSLPPDQFEKEYNRRFQDAAHPNPLIVHYTVVLPRIRWAQAYNYTRRRLLQAAIAIQLEGPAALARFTERGDVFLFVPEQHGFRLESELKDDQGPIFLSTEPNE